MGRRDLSRNLLLVSTWQRPVLKYHFSVFIPNKSYSHGFEIGMTIMTIKGLLWLCTSHILQSTRSPALGSCALAAPDSPTCLCVPVPRLQLPRCPFFPQHSTSCTSAPRRASPVLESSHLTYNMPAKCNDPQRSTSRQTSKDRRATTLSSSRDASCAHSSLPPKTS